MLELDGTLIIAIISFVIFAFIMNAVLYHPIMKILEEREQFIKDNSACENAAKEEAEKIAEQKQKELSEARFNASQKVNTNLEMFKKEQRTATEEFGKVQKEKAEQEKQQIFEEAKSASEEIKSDIDNLSEMIKQKVLGGRNV